MVFVPNILTVIRLALVPLFIILIDESRFGAALVVFIVAGLTDALDGFIAQRFNCETKIGAILDPLADKALLIAAYLVLAGIEKIPFWLMIVVVSRDIIILGGCLLITLIDKMPDMSPSKLSKLNTVLQILAVVVVLATLAGWFDLTAQLTIFYYAVFVSSVLSGTFYVWQWGFSLNRSAEMYEPKK
ncbi:MAG: CDP-alcohol phosphatidyltransferase family protein [Proteobacteria bacterium]|nr:CDP-alcohol phosphatidyltransferase family protein [Pseudomonadota bacterium]